MRERIQEAVQRAEQHLNAATEARKAVDEASAVVLKEMASESPNINRIKNALDKAREKVVVAEVTGNLGTQYAELALDETRRVLDPDALMFVP